MFAKTGRAPSILLFAALIFANQLGGLAKAAEQSTPTGSATQRDAFGVKPSDIRLPADVPLGQYVRIVRPFPNWTLICDENLTKKQKICNISQTIVDRSGESIFSWSLAADETGQPIFILRTPPDVGAGGSIRLDLSDGSAPVVVPIRGCDAKVCVAYQQVGPRLRAAISKASAIRISFNREASSTAVSFQAPLDGLAISLKAI